MSGTGGGEHGEIPTRLLGRTGERVSAIGLGGWHLALKHVDEPLSIRICPERDRSRHHLHGQLLGLQRRRRASSAWARRCRTATATRSS